MATVLGLKRKQSTKKEQDRYAHSFSIPYKACNLHKREILVFELWLKGRLRKMRASLGSEVTSFIVSAMFFAVFLYVAKDFLQGSLAEVGSTIQRHGLVFVAGVVLFYGGLTSISCFATPIDWQKLERFSGGLGRRVSLQQRSLRLSLSLIVLWVVLASVWLVLGLGSQSYVLLLPLIVGIAFGFLSQVFKKPSLPGRQKQGFANTGIGRLFWRYRFLLSLAVVLAMLLIGLIVYLNLPAQLLVVAVWASMLPLNLMVQLMLTEDLKSSWLGRNLGQSHGGYQMGWYKSILGGAVCVFALTALALVLLGSVVGGFDLVFGLGEWTALAGAVSSGLVLAPATVYLLDAFKPVSRFIVCGFLSLICLTVSLAHPLGFVAALVIAAFAESQQAGHYYRVLWG